MACASITPTGCTIQRNISAGCRRAAPVCSPGEHASPGAERSDLCRGGEDPGRTASTCRSDWPVHGTTGYDFGALLNGLVRGSFGGDSRMERTYRAFTRRDA